MITELKVDGFKSLQNFEISFNKGLNVLIGPNGAGKSNICQALGLLASVAEGTISDYVLSLGGASSVFSIDGSSKAIDEKSKVLSISCKGETKAEEEEKSVSLKYHYSLIMKFDDELRITKETLTLYKLLQRGRYGIILQAERTDRSNVTINIRRAQEVGPSVIKDIIEKKTKTKKVNFRADDLVSIFGKDPVPFSILARLLESGFFYCHAAVEDMRYSKTWNIDPHIAKRSSDILEPSKMLPDGRRLSNAIYSMLRFQANDVDEINDLLSRIMPNYGKMDTAHVPDSTRRSFSVVDSKGVSFPAHSLSDGTVKALALLVGIFSQETGTSIIEEPENCLHPWACQTLIDSFREHFTDSVCILTTHSETILNSIRPTEIIVIENKEGFTRSFRLSQEKEMTNAIRMSGFGCGYHYLAGSLGGTPE